MSRLVFIVYRLRASGQVDDGEPVVPQCNAVVQVDSRSVGAAVVRDRKHSPDKIEGIDYGAVETQKSGYSTHRGLHDRELPFILRSRKRATFPQLSRFSGTISSSSMVIA